MNKTKLLLLALAGLFAASCVADVAENQTISAEAQAAKKFVNTSAEAAQGELIIYVDEATAQQLEAAEVATRSGVMPLDNLAQEVGATNLKPVFNLAVNGDVKRARGMHRWYTISFPAETNLEAVAQKLSMIDVVERVQFATKIERPVAQAVEADPALCGATRSDDMPFDDPMLYKQWHYRNLGLQEIHPQAKAGADVNLFPAWEITKGRRDIIVAVVDEGVCYEHEDLVDNMWINEAEANGTEGVDDDGNGYVDDVHGYNFAHNGRITWTRSKDSGHGTHVAGTVAAVNNNGIGVSGVAGGSGNGDGVRIMSCQIISGETDAGAGGTASAVEYAADMGACILQNSWGFGAGQVANDSAFANGSTSVELEAFHYFMETQNNPNLEGGIIIFAAGNDGKAVAGYPGAYNEIIAVTAIGPDGLPTYYTNYDRGCNVAATGGEYAPVTWSEQSCVLSTVPTNIAKSGYAYMQGTSMACPHVSGITALALSYAMDNNIVLSLKELKDIVVSSVTNINPSLSGFKTNVSGGTLNLASYNNKMGTGLIDAYRVLMAVRGTKCIALPIGEEVIINVSSYIGDGTNDKIKMLESEISQEVIDALGIENIKWMGGKLMLTCTKPGSALVTLKYVAGGNNVGGGQITGGMEAQQEFAFVARYGVTYDEGTLEPNNPGGWL
ncbi:MAG: S8 family serine peptidase [Alistipes sp.]|nr:S8 family serine peptidase [Alistipes sp.]